MGPVQHHLQTHSAIEFFLFRQSNPVVRNLQFHQGVDLREADADVSRLGVFECVIHRFLRNAVEVLGRLGTRNVDRASANKPAV